MAADVGTSQPSESTRRASGRDERAHRILDAAADLILRWGYDKTTIDDIARTAGVAKGTIYLHWNTREALFAALLRRERVAMLEATRSQLADAREGTTLRLLMRALTQEMLRHPLVKAVFVQDSEVLGKLTRSKRPDDNGALLRSGFEAYLEVLRDHGLVRTDLGLAEQVNVVVATLYGFFLVTPLLPSAYQLPDDQVADLVGEAVHRTLETGHPPTHETEATISSATLEYLDVALGVAQDKLRASLTRTSGKESDS